MVTLRTTLPIDVSSILWAELCFYFFPQQAWFVRIEWRVIYEAFPPVILLWPLFYQVSQHFLDPLSQPDRSNSCCVRTVGSDCFYRETPLESVSIIKQPSERLSTCVAVTRSERSIFFLPSHSPIFPFYLEDRSFGTATWKDSNDLVFSHGNIRNSDRLPVSFFLDWLTAARYDSSRTKIVND